MGNLLSLCCVVCCKYSFYANELSYSICEKLEKNISHFIVSKGFNLKHWHISLKRDVYSQYRHSLTTRIYLALKSKNIPVLTMGGWAQGHFTENLVYFLTKNLIDEDYRLAMIENKYTILDIPTNTLFYNSPEINISDNYIENFSKKIYTVKNNDNKIEVLNSTNENSSFHKIFDVNLEHKLIDNLHNISNNKLSEIIELSYNNYIKKGEDEEILLKKNNIV